jgi:hypothetical protein
VSDQLKTLRAAYKNPRVVIDGANKQGVEHMRRVYQLPLEAAEKSGKYDFIRMMNTDLQMGRIKVVRKECRPLIDEWRSLEWDKRDPSKENESIENHCADAALYGWRLARHYLAEPVKPKPAAVDSEEAFNQMMERRARPNRARRGLL